jgi:hypothetical protein
MKFYRFLVYSGKFFLLFRFSFLFVVFSLSGLVIFSRFNVEIFLKLIHNIALCI